MRFKEVEVGKAFAVLDHQGEEVGRYRKTSDLGIGGMHCNAVRLPEETPCWVAFDKTVAIQEEQ